MADLTEQEREELIAALSAQQQADADGVMVKVSREAVDKAILALRSVRQEPVAWRLVDKNGSQVRWADIVRGDNWTASMGHNHPDYWATAKKDKQVADETQPEGAPHRWQELAPIAAAPPSASVEQEYVMGNMTRSVLLWVLWHHQGGSSLIGQPIRKMLGMGKFQKLTREQSDAANELEKVLTSAPSVEQARREALKEAAKQVPTNWCDPLLTGPNAAIKEGTDCRQIEVLLRGIQDRIRALAQGGKPSPVAGTEGGK